MARLVLLAFAGLAMVASATAACSGKPLNSCDFFFEGHLNMPPTYKLPIIGLPKVLSTPVYYKTGALVLSASTGGNTSCTLDGKYTCGDTFFFAPKGGKFAKYVNRNNLLASRPVGKTNVTKFQNKCVTVYLETGRIKAGKGVGNAVWFNGNQLTQLFPLAKRCVMFTAAF